MFWSIFEHLCNEKGISPNAVCKEIGLGSSAATYWKQGSWPRQSTLEKIADFFGYTAEEIVAMKGTQISNESEALKPKTTQDGSLPKLNTYKWWFAEDTEADKLYNKVSYALHMLHGSLKANAMMSAVGLPADEPGDIDALALEWLADKCHTLTSFFTEGSFETGKSDVKSLKDIAKGHDYYNTKNTKADYPEMEKWDANYAYLFNLAVEETTSSEYIAEIFEEFSRYPNEHADLMAYIRQGIANFETDRQKRLDRRNAEMNAQKEETA